MVATKTEWDITSITPSSSSPASPKRHMTYFVQSPRDSHDKSSYASAPTPPAYSSSSPMDSPSHPSSTYYGRPSNPRSSSASRISGWSFTRFNRKRSPKNWHVIKEETDHPDDMYGDDGEERRSVFWVAVLGFCLLFGAFSLIIWGASRPFKTHIIMEGLSIHSLNMGVGIDRTGVATKMMKVNCTATMSIHNPATFFGIYVSSYPVDLFFTEITVATGELKKYFQPRKSSRKVSINLDGHEVPLYGAGAALKVSDNNKEGVPLKLDFTVQSCGYLVGSLVQTKHQTHISCSLKIAYTRGNVIKFKEKSCIFM